MARHKPYKRLRDLLYSAEIDYTAVAQTCGRSLGYVNLRFRGLAVWDAHDMTAIAAVLGIPQAEYYIYFFDTDEAEKPALRMA